MIIFFSGEEDRGTPERVLGRQACLMFTFYTMQRKPHKRFRFVIKIRKKSKRSK